VLQGIVDGKTNQEIGLMLNISEKTVEKHLESVYSKLGVAS
jgi:DNA-binding NarL/FixJ family response regulator